MTIELPPYLNLRQCRHGPMLYPRTDKYVGRSLELYGEFSEGEHELFTQLVGPGAVIVEVGANIGAHTVGLAKLVGLSGAVISFEPQPVLFQIMTANMALNGLSNARPILAGLAERGGTLKLPLIDYTQENNFGAFQLSENGDDIVEVRTLDSYGLTRLNLLKIDVEGMEQNVIDGARETIARHRPMMYVENDRKEKSRALIETVAGLGYRLWWHFPTLFRPDNYRGNPDDVFGTIVSANMLCLPAEMPAEISLREVRDAGETWFEVVNEGQPDHYRL